jgi:hypothetical protein
MIPFQALQIVTPNENAIDEIVRTSPDKLDVKILYQGLQI